MAEQAGADPTLAGVIEAFRSVKDAERDLDRIRHSHGKVALKSFRLDGQEDDKPPTTFIVQPASDDGCFEVEHVQYNDGAVDPVVIETRDADRSNPFIADYYNLTRDNSYSPDEIKFQAGDRDSPTVWRVNFGLLKLLEEGDIEIIEVRDGEEVSRWAGQQVVGSAVGSANPAGPPSPPPQLPADVGHPETRRLI